MGFHPLTIDPSLFIHKDCIIILYIDDAVLFGKSDATISDVLGQFKSMDYNFSNDGSFLSYLGIKLKHHDDRMKSWH